MKYKKWTLSCPLCGVQITPEPPLIKGEKGTEDPFINGEKWTKEDEGIGLMNISNEDIGPGSATL